MNLIEADQSRAQVLLSSGGAPVVRSEKLFPAVYPVAAASAVAVRPAEREDAVIDSIPTSGLSWLDVQSHPGCQFSATGEI